MAIDVSRDGNVTTVTINRPEVLNALNTEHLRQLVERVKEVTSDSETRVIIITGSGERAFVAGADIAEMRDKRPSEALEFAQLGHSVCSALEAAPQPVIAAINGFALGGGCEIALASDIRLASENALLGQPEVGLGIVPGWGATQRLTRLVGPGIAKELIYTGRRVRAEEALRLGLVNAVYAQDQLMTKAQEMAGQIANNAPIAIRYSKAAINTASDVDIDTGLTYESQLFALAFDSADQREGMTAFLERRKPQFSGQ